MEPAAWIQTPKDAVGPFRARQLVRGKVDAIDGTGWGNDYRLVGLVCVSDQRPTIVAWRRLEGPASEKGQEAAVTRALIEPALELGGPECLALVLIDALYCDGPRLAWLAYAKGIDVLTPLPSDRLKFADLLGLARRGLLELPHDADDPGVRYGAGVPQSWRCEVGPAGDSPVASAVSEAIGRVSRTRLWPS